MTSPILIATDLTARSDRPLDRAAQLAQQRGSGLVIVHVLGTGPEEVEAARAARARRILIRQTEHLGTPFDTVLEAGSPPKVVAGAAERRQAAVIVVGAARYNHVTDFVLGTAVDYLARHVAIPLLVVKERPNAPYDGIVVGTDFSDRSAHALLAAADLVPDVRITLVHGFARPFATRIGAETAREVGHAWASAEMQKFLNRPELVPLHGRIAPRLVDGPPDLAINLSADTLRHPLAVLGGRGRSAAMQALLGNHAAELMGTIGHDVLLVR
ncbi:universal stress protein [Azorhizobium oxalatiphilum]|uniref:universal stress protein n=1 Tax=Azorhizobium oxalatiphilum TaxID=980631 RepID=UPI00166505A1|nr:universal stress protein [Azorhizobium oxalatiphilum]